MENSNTVYIEIDFFHLMKRLWRWAWVIVLAAAVCGAAAFSLAYFAIAPKYQASALMYVNNSSFSVGSTTVSLSDLSASQTLVDSYIVILKARLTLNEVIEQADLDYDYETLCEMIDAEAVNSTEIFKITVTSEDPEEAEKIANTIVEVLPEKIAKVMDGSSVRTVDSAIVPSKRYSPSYTVYTAVGLVLGLTAGCGAVLLAEILDDQVRNEEDLIQAYSLPVLASIPDLSAPMKHRGYGGYDSYYEAAEERKEA